MTNANNTFQLIKNSNIPSHRAINLAELVRYSATDVSLIADNNEIHSEDKSNLMTILSSSNSSTNQNHIKVTPLIVKIKSASRSLEDLCEIISDNKISKDDSLILEEYLENMENSFK